MNDEVFNAVFFSFVVTSAVGFIIAIVKICSKSKCKTCKFCGIVIERDIEAEIEEEKMELAAHPRTEEEKVDR